jgi:pyruvate/2-oxoglutarate dehydrogenase complex dihydrolipoamide dehydrogenase (E3) component
MIKDYNLVIIGNTNAAIYAAITSVQMQARTALVIPADSNWLTSGFFCNQILKNISKIREKSLVDHQQTEILKPYGQAIINNHYAYHDPDILSMLGIDVIFGDGQFLNVPQLSFVVNNRSLISHSYLIATGSYTPIPDIPGIPSINYLTPDTIWQKINPEQLSDHWVIIGGNPSAIEITQTLVNLAVKSIHLVTQEKHILPQEDQDNALFIQACLEGQGVHIYTQTEVTQLKEIQQEKWVLIGNKAIAVDEIVIATDPQANIKGLNLEQVKVKFNQTGIDINQKMQTSNPKIYACGDVSAVYDLPHVQEYQAQIAVKNALFFPIHKVNYHQIPYCIFSQPELARVGLTESQAKKLYGEKILILKQQFKTLLSAQIIDKISGYAKIIVLSNGKILGATIIGENSGEIIQIIALAMKTKTSIKTLAQMPIINPTFAEIIYKTALEYQKQINQKPLGKNLLEKWFNWQRK